MELDPKPSDVIIVLTCIWLQLLMAQQTSWSLLHAHHLKPSMASLVNHQWFTFADHCETHTGSLGASPEDVVTLRGLKQEVLMCVNNSAAVAILGDKLLFGTSFVSLVILDFC